MREIPLRHFELLAYLASHPFRIRAPWGSPSRVGQIFTYGKSTVRSVWIAPHEFNGKLHFGLCESGGGIQPFPESTTTGSLRFNLNKLLRRIEGEIVGVNPLDEFKNEPPRHSKKDAHLMRSEYAFLYSRHWIFLSNWNGFVGSLPSNIYRPLAIDIFTGEGMRRVSEYTHIVKFHRLYSEGEYRRMREHPVHANALDLVAINI